ncbi:MAG: MBL fold metallo-hydrolase [Candidatus Diapherotrites archaeon]|nr:MBL fold metallo-hydrolase [Candidatus Diapherotrites archaeon]
MIRLRYLHHSFFELSCSDRKILIDPFFNIPKGIKINAKTKCPISEKTLKNVDIILISHEHFDHFDKDFIESVVGNKNCKIVAHDSLLNEIKAPLTCKQAIAPSKKIILDDISIEAFHVHHPNSFYPLGFKIESPDTTIVHMGDTFLMDSFNKIKADVLILPIGGQMTLDVVDAVRLVKTIEPDIAIPMHYNTFDFIKASPKEFKEKIEDSVVNSKAKNLKFGETIKL